MRPKLIAQALDVCFAARQPAMLHGEPGCGKSAVVHQAADRYSNGRIIDLRLSQLDPVDLRGIPFANMKDMATNWLTAGFLPREGRGVLFLDEINSASQAIQAASYQLVLDRKLGDYTLPPEWVLVAAGNRMQDRAIVNQMSTALRNRFVHIDYDINNEDWCLWALKKNIHTAIIGFIRFRPMLLSEFTLRNPSKEEKDRVSRMKDSHAFATPRSWEFLSRIMEKNPDPSFEFELYKGVIGEGAAAEFLGYLKYYRDLPNLDAVIMDPGKSKVPTEPATLFALATGLAAKANEDNLERIAKYVARMQPEFQVLTMKDAVTRDEKLSNHKAFNEWAIKNTDVLL